MNVSPGECGCDRDREHDRDRERERKAQRGNIRMIWSMSQRNHTLIQAIQNINLLNNRKHLVFRCVSQISTLDYLIFGVAWIKTTIQV